MQNNFTFDVSVGSSFVIGEGPDAVHVKVLDISTRGDVRYQIIASPLTNIHTKTGEK